MPGIDGLKSESYSSVDLHVHTNFSYATTSIRRIAEYPDAKWIGIAVTNHNEIRGIS